MKGMRAIKIAAGVMGALIVLGTLVLIVTIARRSSGPVAVVAGLESVLDEPTGTRIATITAVQDRLAVQLHGGGPDRVVFVDPRTGTVAGRVSLAH